MDIQTKKIGIWGFGIVGKAALNYFYTKKNPIMIMDSRELTSQENNSIRNHGAILINQKECKKFLEENDFILASPGIDLHNYSNYTHKFITELDLFTQENNKQIIAITGTIGKTSVTHLLSMIIKKHEPLITGGNIGIGMLDLLNRTDAKKVILELSSFQLEYNKLFAPDLAIWTNFYPNHLDRHLTLEEYFNAKYTMLKYQNAKQNALVPLELAAQIVHTKHTHQNAHGTLHFFSTAKPCLHIYNRLPKDSTLFWIENSIIIHYKDNKKQELIPIKNLPLITFETNWLIITAALTLLNIPLNLLSNISETPLEHRIEKVFAKNQIEIYNDSKSTIMESTLAAVEKLNGKKIILLLGGLSKGVDRKTYIAQLKGKVKKIICFGAEAVQLNQYAQESAIASRAFPTLDESVFYTLEKIKPEEQILFSPGGSSYDLFKNYEERGTYFKQLIHKYYAQSYYNK